MSDNNFNSTAIFGEVKKRVLSKDFKFGQITNVFGQTTIDFSNADIDGPVVLDSTQFCGEVRIKVPANWRIVNEVTNIGFEIRDKRRAIAEVDPNKILVLRGIGILAAIKIVDCAN